MEKYKKLKLSLITLLLALIVALTAAVFAIKERGVAAFAADRYVELDGNSVFYTTIRGAEISESEVVGEGEAAKRYTLFKMGTEETVSYRQNLAYTWISSNKNDDLPGGEDYITNTLSMELYFQKINFKRFYIKFESQQNVLTKDAKSTNYLVFTAVGSGNDKAVQVSVSKTIEEKEGEIEGMVDIGSPYKANEHIKFALGAYVDGDYTVNLEGAPTAGKFENVYENYATYVASGDSAVTPLTFGAVFEGDNVDTGDGAEMALVEISGQSFEMHKQGDTYKVKDTAAPVICFNQTPSYLEYGKSIGFQYKVIDVLASSPRATAYYYVLKGKQVEKENYDFDKTDYDTKTTDGEGEGETETQENPFIKVTSSSGIRIVTDNETFIPRKYLKSDVMGLVKIYYELSDVSSTSTAQTDKVFVNWYVKEAGKADTALETVKGSEFLKLIKSKEGATYAREGDATLDDYKASVEHFREEYQTAINEAIEKLDDGKLYAGGNKFYLPSIENGFLDDYLVGTDYKYSIYYKGSSTGTHSSLAYNQLAIDLNDADVTYRFTILISDTFGNPMRYPDENGEWQEITSDDVWDEDYALLLPFFEFDVSYKEATAEPPENLSLSYVGNSYSGVTFKITGVSQTYTTSYKLYVFNRNEFSKDYEGDAEMLKVLNYGTFVENTEKLLNNTYKADKNTRKYFTTVKAASELLESDNNYETFKALNWNATSITFTPQSVEDFYVVELNLTDKRSQERDTQYATVAASVQTTALKGESDWLGDNKTSVILFAVAGVCLVALIILLVIKPKDKGDIDAIYTEVEGGGKKQKKEKNNK